MTEMGPDPLLKDNTMSRQLLISLDKQSRISLLAEGSTSLYH